MCMVKGAGGGGHRRFYWAALTWVRANLEIRMDKSRSPAFVVWTLQEDREPKRAERRGGSGVAGAGDTQRAPSLGPSLQAGNQMAGPSLAAHQPTWGGRDGSTPNTPAFLWNAPTFTLNARSPSGLLTRSQPPRSEMEACASKAAGPPGSLTRLWQLPGSSSANFPPAGPSEKGLLPQAQRGGSSGCCPGGGGWALRMMEAVLSVLLGGKA